MEMVTLEDTQSFVSWRSGDQRKELEITSCTRQKGHLWDIEVGMHMYILYSNLSLFPLVI